MPEMTKEFPIGKRDEGEKSLICVECGRAWGKDDVRVPKNMANGVEPGPGETFTPDERAVGLCPWCQDMEGKAALVYPSEPLSPEKEAASKGK